MSTTAESMTSLDVDEKVGRPSSLEAQPPGLDAEQGALTLWDATAPQGGADEPGRRRILIPLDGSRRATAALPYAVAVACATGARISLLAVVEPLHLRTGLPSAASLEDDGRHVAVSSAYLESVATPLRAQGLAVTTVVRHGNPAGEILADSEEEECSLVVMGTHGRTGLARLRMGSVAQHVLRHAIIPTLVVPPGDDEPAEGAATIAAITVTLDGSPLAEEALPFAASIARSLAAPLRLLRVIPRLTYPAAGWDAKDATYYALSEELAREEDRAAEAYLETVATRLRVPGLEVRTARERNVTGGVEEHIAADLAKQPMGLAVMASHGRGGVLRWALGSITEAVLARSPCPILIVRAGATTSAGREQVPPHAVQNAG